MHAWIAFVSCLFAAWSVAARPSVGPEHAVARLELSRPSSPVVVATGPLSPIWTHEGTVYDAYIDPERRLVLDRKRPSGETDSAVVFEVVRRDNHNGPSIAVDRSGYIHVTGDMHNGSEGRCWWNYWVSDRPGDISSFTYRGGKAWGETWIPSNMITYVLFRPDNGGNLYVSYRGRVTMDMGQHGNRAVMMARHMGDKPGPWEGLGVPSPNNKGAVWPATCIGWEPYSKPGKVGGEPIYYQTHRGHFWFDARNRLHLAWVVYGPGARNQGVTANVGSGATHILYARSDDGGKTWQGPDDRPLELPIGLDNGHVVLSRNPGDLTSTCFLTVTQDGRPVITYVLGGRPMVGENYMVVWQKSGGWSEPMRLPTGPNHNFRIVADRQGVFTLPDEGTWYRSRDEGRTWTAIEDVAPYAGGSNSSIDYPHLIDTGEIRYHTIVERNGTPYAEVWTVRFE